MKRETKVKNLYEKIVGDNLRIKETAGKVGKIRSFSCGLKKKVFFFNFSFTLFHFFNTTNGTIYL